MPSADQRGIRPEIQALRAAAVLAVVGFHLWPGRFPGGYIGVDAFFVISGFLITGHLLREVQTHDRVRLGAFWARRARRLLPAAYLVLVATTVAVWLWLPSAQWTQNFRQVVGSALYVQNWVLAADSVDYLAADDLPSAVQHYWTLSVEEQFYAVWPVLVVVAVAVARRRAIDRRRAVAVTLAIVTVASFVHSLWMTSHHPQVAYFATSTRAWQFGAGALLAIVAAREPRWRPHVGIPMSWLGLGLIVWCTFAFDAATPFPGVAAIVPVCGALLVIAAGSPRGRLSPAPLMALGPVQRLGDLSYSIYLWHWPPIVLLPQILGHELGFWPRVGILVGTVVLASLTTRFVENPIRFGRHGGVRRPAVAGRWAAAGAAVVVGIASLGWQAGHAEERRAAQLTAKANADMPRCFGAASRPAAGDCVNRDLAATRVPDGPDVAADFGGRPECWVGNLESELKTCSFGDPTSGAPRVLLVGDSHARALLPAFVRLADVGELSVTAQLKGGCAWSADLPGRTAIPEVLQTCPAWRERVKQWIVDHRDSIDLIVTTAYVRSLAGSPTERADGLAKAWRPAADLGIPIAAIVDNPLNVDGPPAPCLDRHRTWDESTCAVRRDEAFAWGDPIGRAAELTPGAERIDLTDFYCDTRWCPAVIGGVTVYRDAHHLTTTYTRTLAPFLWQRITAAIPALTG